MRRSVGAEADPEPLPALLRVLDLLRLSAPAVRRAGGGVMPDDDWLAPAADYDEAYPGDQPPPESVNGEESGPSDRQRRLTEVEERQRLVIEDLADVVARVDAAPAPRYLARPVWPAEDYGVIAAEQKVGKTWLVLDLAVAVAAGGSWLGTWPCGVPGPVLLFLGEGSERKTVRRLRAVCDHYGLTLSHLDAVRVCHRVPNLGADIHVAQVHAELDAYPARLVVLDPLYLASVLGPIQRACQQAGAALALSHHWNKTGTGKGPERMSGAGAAEWGGVLVSADGVSRRREPDGTTDAVLELRIVGDDIADTTARLRRRVRARSENLASSMVYDVEMLGHDEPPSTTEERPSVTRVRHVLDKATEPSTIRLIGDRLAVDGHPLKHNTIQRALTQLARLAAAEAVETDAYGAQKWAKSSALRPTTASDPPEGRTGSSTTEA
jgi:hypothetical protein